MPLILWCYFGGLTLAVSIGFVFYFVIGGHGDALWANLFGQRAGYFLARSFRMMLVASAIIGGLSVEWYGCSYTDYDAIASDPGQMARLMTNQVAESMFYATAFLISAAVIGGLTFAVLNTHKRRQS